MDRHTHMRARTQHANTQSQGFYFYPHQLIKSRGCNEAERHTVWCPRQDTGSQKWRCKSSAGLQHCVKCGPSLWDFPLMKVQCINGKSIPFYLSVLSATARLPHLAWANMKTHREAICCKLAQLPFHLLASNWTGLRKCNWSDCVSVSACVDSKLSPRFPHEPWGHNPSWVSTRIQGKHWHLWNMPFIKCDLAVS